MFWLFFSSVFAGKEVGEFLGELTISSQEGKVKEDGEEEKDSKNLHRGHELEFLFLMLMYILIIFSPWIFGIVIHLPCFQ